MLRSSGSNAYDCGTANSAPLRSEEGRGSDAAAQILPVNRSSIESLSPSGSSTLVELLPSTSPKWWSYRIPFSKFRLGLYPDDPVKSIAQTSAAPDIYLLPV